jgi:type II secretory pathway pseudopilin PulG
MRGRDQSGFMLVEVVVGALCLALIIGAVSSIFVQGNDSALAEENQAALVEVANQQIEQVRQLVKIDGFTSLAMKTLPSAGSTTTLYSNTSNVPIDPNYYYKANGTCPSSGGGSGGEYAIQSNWDDKTSSSVGPGSTSGDYASVAGCDSGYEPLIVSSSGFVTASQTVTVGGGAATLDTYVTQTQVGCNASLGSGNCSTDARRVIIAVVPAAGATYRTQQNSPLYVSTVFTNPTPSNAPNASAGLTLGVQLG